MKKTEEKTTQTGQGRNHKQNPRASSGNALIFEKAIDNPGTLREGINNFRKTMLATLAVLATLFFVSCNSPAEKVENAKENVTQAKEDLTIAQQEYIAEVEFFRTDSDKELTAFENQIAEIKGKIKTSNKELRAEYEKDILVLEQKNKDLRKKMTQYKADKKEDWVSFKTEFYDDMNELGLALKNFTIDKQ